MTQGVTKQGAATLWPGKAAWLAAAAVLVVTLIVLLSMDRPLICECGTVKLWHGVVQSPENSQHLADWYTPSHIIHGFLFYGAAWLLFVKAGLARGAARFAFPIAAAVEAGWEILENTPMIIDRYREVTVSWGYVGDSIVNSMADIGWMMAGFLLAARLPVWLTVTMGIAAELLTTWLIRDGLALNILMLVWPLDAVRDWQVMG